MQNVGKILKVSPENIYLKACSDRFPRTQSALFLISALNYFQRVLKVSDCSGKQSL